MTCAVLSELMPGVLPSASSTLAPKDQATDQYVECASEQWLMAMPTGLPCFLRIRPSFSSSAHVFGGSRPAFLKWAMLYVPGKDTQNHGMLFQPDLVWLLSAAKLYQPPPCLPTFSTTSSMLARRFSYRKGSALAVRYMSCPDCDWASAAILE